MAYRRNMPGQGEAELLGMGEDELTILPVPGVRVRFERDASGAVHAVTVVISGRPMRARRLAG